MVFKPGLHSQYCLVLFSYPHWKQNLTTPGAPTQCYCKLQELSICLPMTLGWLHRHCCLVTTKTVMSALIVSFLNFISLIIHLKNQCFLHTMSDFNMNVKLEPEPFGAEEPPLSVILYSVSHWASLVTPLCTGFLPRNLIWTYTVISSPLPFVLLNNYKLHIICVPTLMTASLNRPEVGPCCFP